MYQRNKFHSRPLCKRIGTIAALGAVIATPALGEPENPYGGGSRIPQQVQTIDRGHHQTRMILKDFAKCNVTAHREDVRNYLLKDAGEVETEKLRNKALSTSCLDREVGADDLRFRFTGLSLQGSLAEQMLETDGLLSRPLDVSAITPLHHSDLNPEQLKKLDASAQQQLFAEQYLFRFGECVVRADAAGSAALLRSELDSDAESAAFNQLMPAFGSCVEANRKLTGDKIEMRATVAYNYYRLTSAPRISPPIATAKK